MNRIQRITIVGFAVAGTALLAPAAMADTFHGQSGKAAGPGGAVSSGLVSAAVGGHHGKGKHKGHGGVFYGKFTQTAGPLGATSFGTVSAAD